MSYTSCIYHIVFRTKRSQRTITETYERELFQYIFNFVRSKGCHLYRVNSMPDHVHLLVGLVPNISLSDFVRELKSASSTFLTLHRQWFPFFESWGKEYFACSYCVNDVDTVKEYIKNQKKHHEKHSFAEELRILCESQHIIFNEKYL